MFQLKFGGRELSRRLGRTVLTALGLAAGVGLVLGILGISRGLDDAQGRVLSPLKSVGTDVLVTRVVGAGGPSPAPGANPAGGGDASDSGVDSLLAGGSSGFFGGNAGSLNADDATALVNENESVVTDLSKLGKPGEKFTHDFFLPATLLSFPDDAVGRIRGLPGVTSAVGGLSVLAEHETGTVPKIVTQIETGGNKVGGVVTPPPMTPAEQETFRKCLVANKAFPTTPTTKGQPAPPPNDAAFEKCLPKRFKQFRTELQAPLKNIQKVVNPPKTDVANASYTAAGVDPTSPHEGLVTADQVTSGQFLDAGANDEVLLNVAYATKKKLAAGGKLSINGKDYRIVGLVTPALSGDTADVYFPLSVLQDLSSKQSRVNAVLVKARNAASVPSVAREISSALPGAQVVTAKQLTQQVTGSLADAKHLARRLGGALGVVVLLAAFAIAVLLTLSSVAKRVREIGTLRAVGWSKTRVVRQLVLETLGIGIIGAAIGIGLGYAVSAAVSAFSPTLTATAGAVPGVASAAASGLFGATASTAAGKLPTTTIHLRAPIRLGTLLLGVCFAMVGGLLAGIVGGWRAARLSPAHALRNLG